MASAVEEVAIYKLNKRLSVCETRRGSLEHHRSGPKSDPERVTGRGPERATTSRANRSKKAGVLYASKGQFSLARQFLTPIFPKDFQFPNQKIVL